MRRLLVRSLVSSPIAIVATAALWFGGSTTAYAYPPTPPDKTTSQSYLNALTVRAEGSGSGYDRDLFPHWHTVSGTCNTRETVLKRDGVGVTTDSACRATGGDWYSVYDGIWLDSATEVQIDHIVPLAEAWRSGASSWTTSRREQFANDLTRAELIAVSGTSNQAKGDKDPAAWKPANTSTHCIYAREWIWVKHYYSLTLQSTEKSALQAMLNTC